MAKSQHIHSSSQKQAKRKRHHVANPKEEAEWRKRYKAYINSAGWKNLRCEAIQSAGNMCDLCGRSDNLHVHHLTYARFTHENLSDLRVLCKDCHEASHGGKFTYPKRPKKKAPRQRKKKQLSQAQLAYGEWQREQQVNREMASVNCKRCARCCCVNGLIPPYTPTEDVPKWAIKLCAAMTAIPVDIRDSLPCMFLKNDGLCAIYEIRPRKCRQYVCDDCYDSPEL